MRSALIISMDSETIGRRRFLLVDVSDDLVRQRVVERFRGLGDDPLFTFEKQSIFFKFGRVVISSIIPTMKAKRDLTGR